jgi:hypothetical protein
MSSFIFSGGVEVLGFISPTDTSDEYAVIDPLYGIDGLRNVSSISELNAITTLRRRPGMVVGVNNGSEYYKLNPAPWNGTLSDWSLFTPGIFTGGTVSGETNFTSGVTATIFSAGTYLNLPIDNTVTGGTYNPSNGSVTFTNNTGGTFTVTGFITGFTDIQVTGYTYSANTFTIYDSSGNTFSATINSMTGLTVNGAISATTISASTYQNLPITTLTVNSTPISGGTSGRVFFQNSANTLSQSSNLFWDNANGRLGVGTSSPGRPLTVVNSILGVVALFGGQNAAPSWVGIGSVDGGSSPFIQGYDTSVTGTTKLSLNANGSNVLIGTTTDAGFRLDVNGTARVQGEANVSFLSLAGNTAVNNSGSIMILGASGAWTGVRVPRYFEISGSINASSGFTRGTFINQTLVATANNDTLYALDIAPSFTTGSFTGVTSVPLRIRNSSGTGNAFYIDGIGNAVIAGSLNTNTVYGTGNINLSSGSGNLLLQTNFTVNTGLVMFNSTRNIVIQNGGTFTDAGFRLDVSGNTRINGGLTATTISATTYQNLPSDVIIINSTQIQSGSTGGILFQSSASTVSQSSNLFWDNVNGFLGIKRTPIVEIDVLGSIRASSFIFTDTTQTRAIQSNSSNLVIRGVGNIFATMFQTTGNFVFQNGGTFTDAGFKLDVNGTGRFQNQLTLSPPTNTTALSVSGYNVTGSSSQIAIDIAGTWNTSGAPTLIKGNVTNTLSDTNSLLMDLQVGGVSQFRVTRSGYGIINSIGTNINILSGNWYAKSIPVLMSAGTEIGIAFTQVINGTGGAARGFDSFTVFSPTSGNLTWVSYGTSPTINQTGGANGITRGLYINPTLTAAADWRAIETTNGRVIISDTLTVTGSNATSLLDLSQTWNTSGVPIGIKLNVNDVASNVNSLLMALQTSGVTRFSVTKAGVVSCGTISSNGNIAGFSINTVNGQIGTTSIGLKIPQTILDIRSDLTSTATLTSGNVRGIYNFANFTPTTGTAVWNAYEYNGIINQTGGANGITRGFYSNPTLTAAADWRSIEWSNNTGWGLYGVGTANNYLNGNLGIRTTNPQAILNVVNTGTTGTTALFSGAGQNVVTIVGSGSTQPIFTIQGSSGELFSVTDSLTGSLFSVNDISGLPILEVFSNNTTLMGSYLAPSLNTTAYVIATIGTTNVYSIPTSAYTGAFFDYTVSDGTNLRAGNIMSIWSGTSVNFTETSTTDFGDTSGLTFNMVVSSGNVILRTSGTTGNWTVKTIVRSI